MIGALAFLLVVVAIAAVGGLLIGRMIAGRIDRWQVRTADEQAEKERVDHADPS